MKVSIENTLLEQRLDAIEERLSRQAQLIDRHIELVERRDTVRQNWNLFWSIVAGHCLMNYLLLGLSEAVDYPLYLGAVTGSTITLGVWHGLSFRPILQRWQRTIYASTIGLAVACFALDVDLDSVFSLIVIQAVFLLSPTIITANLIGRGFQAGVSAPREANAVPRKLNLLSVICLSAVVAFLLVATRFSIGLLDPSAQSNDYLAILYPTVSVSSSAAIALSVVICGKWPRWWVVLVSIVGCSVLLFVLNSAFVGFSRFTEVPFSWAEFQTGVTESVAATAVTSLVEFAMPAITAAILWVNGHRMIRANTGSI